MKNIHDIIKEYPKVFCEFSEEQILNEYNKIIKGYKKLNIKVTGLDIDDSVDCLEIRGIKDNIELFFNIFFDSKDFNIGYMVNISISKREHYVLEDTIENCFIKLEKLIDKQLP